MRKCLCGVFWHVLYASTPMLSGTHGACRCNDQGQVVIEVQSQLRLGMSDMGVNGRRNEKFMLQLSQAVQHGALPAGRCEG